MGRKTLGKIVLAGIVLGVGVIVYVLFAAASNDGGKDGLDRFATASLSKLVVDPNAPDQPSTKFADADGLEVSLQAFRGKTVLVNLWATWCAPCVKEMPTLAALQRTYGNRAFQVIAVSVDAQADRKAASDELKELSGGQLAFFHDYTYGIAYAAKAVGFPTTILYGPDGKELARIAGEADWDSPEARGLIEAALERAAPVAPAGKS